MDYKILLTLIGFVFVLGACERNSGGTTKLSIQFPEATSKVSAATATPTPTPSSGSSSNSWSSVTPTGLTGANPINCYGVYISGPEDTLRQNQCGRSGSSTPMKYFGVWKGAVPAGGSVELEVDSGKDRVVGVFGFYVSDITACKDITGSTNMDKSKFSKPYFIGESSPQTFTGGTVPVPVTLAFNSDQWFEDCKGPGFPNGTGSGGGGNTTSIDVGTGADGDFVVTSMMTDVRQVNGSLKSVPLITTSRILASSMPDPANPKKLSLTTKNTVLHTKFNANDEVYLYIAASYGNTGCGPNLFTGFRTRGIVESASGDNMIVNTDDARFSTTTNAYLAAPASGVSRDFCRMTVTRVPHLNKLTFNGGYLTWNAASYGDLNAEADNEAGLIIIRVKDSIETLSKGGIDVAGRGFTGGYSTYKDGQGTFGATGMSPTGTANGSGGGGSMSTPYSPGGGGHGGAGGDAVSVGKGGYAVGDEYGCGPSNYDASMKCLFGKIFMGGSGGAGYDASGGSGGGIIVVYANAINVGSNKEMIFSADGSNASGSSMGGAGGAGGTVLVNVNSISVATGGSFRMTSNGGVSTISSGFGLGGAGGGGRNHLNILGACSIVNTGVSMESFAPKNYVVGKGGPGVNGTNYVSGGSSLSTCASSIFMNQSPFMVKADPSSIAADTTNGVPITIYGESLNGIQSAVLQDYNGVTIDTCVITVPTASSFVCTTKAPPAQYSITITDNLGRKRTLSSSINLL